MGELSIVLMTVLATYDKNSTNYIIASYIMNNVKALAKTQNLTTGYLAKQCNVSKASISRFCREVGFDDFYTFKYILKSFYPQYITSKKYNFVKSPKTITTDFIDEFQTSFKLFQESLRQQDLDELCKDIRDYKNVVIMGHQQSFAMALTLQNDLGTAFNKFTMIVGEPSKQAETIEKSTENDLFIVFSATGRFFNHVLLKQKMSKFKGKLYLITVNEDVNFPFVTKKICLGKQYNYPTAILMNLYIGLISSNYYKLIESENRTTNS